MSTNSSSPIHFLSSLEGLDAARALISQKQLPSIEEIARWRPYLSMLVTIYSDELAKLNESFFYFLTEENRRAYQNRLLITYYLLYAQHRLNQVEKRRYPLKNLEESMKKCSLLLDKLNTNEAEITPQSLLQDELRETDKCLKYLGLTTFGPHIAEKITTIIDNEESDDKTNTFKQAASDKLNQLLTHKSGIFNTFMSEVNEVRLYWVWTGSMLTNAISMLPSDFLYTQQANQLIASPNTVLGYMSWMLYFTRGSLQLSLLLKHTIKGPWMDAEEANIPTWNRFKTQWAQRKFSLLNDFIWGFGNLACFFWLTGQGALGYAGGLMTAGLLFMDLTLAMWRFWEEITKHNKFLWDLKITQGKLKNSLKEEQAKAEEEQDKQKIIDLQIKLTENKKIKREKEFAWKYEELKLINNFMYTVALLIAFSVMSCFFLPPVLMTAASTAIIGLAGAILCFLASLAFSIVSGVLDIVKSYSSLQQTKEECSKLIDLFKNTSDENLKKQLYLQMKGLYVDTDYQRRMIRFQLINLIRSVFIDTLVPVVIFSSLVFMPLGIGITVMAAGCALILLSKLLIKQFEPEPEKVPTFDSKVAQEYALFSNKPTIYFFENQLRKNRTLFFATLKAEPVVDDESGESEKPYDDDLLDNTILR